MAPDGGDGSRSSGASGKSGGPSRQVLKKGPWTAVEDAILMEYVKKHGEGNWNSVQRNSGLIRCGKSCRLRWANHLRPNLKKGTFSAEEERLIVELHAKLGNKWARMAAQLPGRTDNEIKNYWNTRVKRRQRAGLPIYPADIQPKHHQLHHHHDQQRQTNHRQQQHQRQPNSSSSSLSSLLSSSSSSHSQKNSHSLTLSLFNRINFPPTANPPKQHPNSSFLPNSNPQFNLFRDNNGGLALSLTSPSLPFPAATEPWFNPGFSSELFQQTPSLHFNSFRYNNNSRSHKEVSFYPISSLDMGIELPSIQSPLPKPSPTSSANTGSGYIIDATSSDAEEYEIAPEIPLGNSGLLEDLVEESQALTRAEKSKKEKSPADNEAKVKCVSEEAVENLWESSIFAPSSIGMKRKKNPLEEMNSMDDDFLSLLDSFPSTVTPVPEWDDKGGSLSNGRLSGMVTAGVVGINSHREVPRSPVVTAAATPHHEWALGSCCWNNLPGICEEQS
ncbi:unnamed protein product [Ilex paraguariensis]|uniref:Uncharacterized protein n=1 Tax=Ilex paraguariensis TaxID=185542 RepID=A0ABC8SMA6_9AQUA